MRSYLLTGAAVRPITPRRALADDPVQTVKAVEVGASHKCLKSSGFAGTLVRSHTATLPPTDNPLKQAYPSSRLISDRRHDARTFKLCALPLNRNLFFLEGLLVKKMHLILTAASAMAIASISSADARTYRYAPVDHSYVVYNDSCSPVVAPFLQVYPEANWGPFFRHRVPVGHLDAYCGPPKSNRRMIYWW